MRQQTPKFLSSNGVQSKKIQYYSKQQSYSLTNCLKINCFTVAIVTSMSSKSKNHDIIQSAGIV